MTKGTVLVVDDDEAIVDMLTMALEGEGYRVLSAIDGSALRLATEQHPSVILLDIQMPVMDGVEVSRRLRADPRTTAIPIIAMSAQDRLHSTAHSMDADDRLAKPFNLRQLYDLVARWAVAP
jgi:CheY-like chemotaxis protein